MTLTKRIIPLESDTMFCLRLCNFPLAIGKVFVCSPLHPQVKNLSHIFSSCFSANKLDIKITQEMINNYAEASKDYNPIHIDEEFASKSLFKSRIAHGMLTISIIMEYLYKIYSKINIYT